MYEATQGTANLDIKLTQALGAKRTYEEFTLTGVYGVNGLVTQTYGGYHKEITITETGLYSIGWSNQGSVRCTHAVDVGGNILETWNGDYFSTKDNKVIDVPVGTVKLLASSYGDVPRDGFLIKQYKANDEEFGLISEKQVQEQIDKVASDEAPHIDILGNMWSDGLWKNATATNTISRVYPIDENETYDLHFIPTIGYEQAISSLSITSQLATGASFAPIVHNTLTLNNLAADGDVVTVNGYSMTKAYITNWSPPAGAKSLIVFVQNGINNPVEGVRLFKRQGAKGTLVKNANANKRIAILGDSVAQSSYAEIGRERLRDALGCTVHTYAVGGAGFPINATPTWVTANNVSGVYQAEELVKAGTEAYDIYCLSGTLNDPVTHQKAIGNINNCKPYLRDGTGLAPDFTDPNLDTMLGAFNFIIQRIYEKNPNAKILISSMNKIFLNAATNGFGTAAGYDPLDTTVGIHGSTYFDYVEALRSLGDTWGIPIVDVYGKAGINEYNKAITMGDQYHPTTRGYERIQNLWFDAIINS